MYAPWTKAFTVVQWDQRGAGHTYGRYRSQTPDIGDGSTGRHCPRRVTKVAFTRVDSKK